MSFSAFNGCTGLIGVQENVKTHIQQLKQWKARGNVLCCISMMDFDYRLEVEGNGGTRGSDLSNDFSRAVLERCSAHLQSYRSCGWRGEACKRDLKAHFLLLTNSIGATAVGNGCG
jgi:hypothetical protein